MTENGKPVLSVNGSMVRKLLGISCEGLAKLVAEGRLTDHGSLGPGRVKHVGRFDYHQVMSVKAELDAERAAGTIRRREAELAAANRRAEKASKRVIRPQRLPTMEPSQPIDMAVHRALAAITESQKRIETMLTLLCAELGAKATSA